jgi:hypothetical protein
LLRFSEALKKELSAVEAKYFEGVEKSLRRSSALPARDDRDDAGIDREGLILEIDMRGADGMIFGDGNPPPDDEACSAFSLMLRSRRFLDALEPTSWINEPNLKVCTGLLHSRLVQFDVVIGNHRASGCEGGRHIGPHSNSQRHERYCRQCYRDTFVHEYPLASAQL